MLNKYYSKKYDRLRIGNMPTFEKIEKCTWSRATKNMLHAKKRAMLKKKK